MPSKKLRILVWNVQRGANHFEQGPEKALQVIKDSGADICLLQESYDIDGPRPHLGPWLAGELGWQEYQGESAHLCIISRYPIEQSWMHQSWHGVGALIRIADGQEIVVYSTWIDYRSFIANYLKDHPDATDPELLACETRESSRLTQAREILGFLEAQGHLNARIPVLIGGDWNCPSHLDWTEEAAEKLPHRRALPLPVSTAVGKAGFVDTFRMLYADPVAKPGITWSPLYRSGPQDRIDRLYLKNPEKGKGLTPVKAEVMPNQLEDDSIPHEKRIFPSDHGALSVQFSW